MPRACGGATVEMRHARGSDVVVAREVVHARVATTAGVVTMPATVWAWREGSRCVITRAPRTPRAKAPPLIRLDSVSKQHGKQILFLEASAAVNRGEKVG